MKRKYALSILVMGLLMSGALLFPTIKKKLPLAAHSGSGRESGSQEERSLVSRDGGVRELGLNRIVIANIATVPFIEVFDLLTAAPLEMRAQWVKQLDEIPEGPRKSAAISSFYKTLVQIDPHGAAESVARFHHPDDQALALHAMVGAAPLSAVEEMAQILVKTPEDVVSNGGSNLWADVFLDWSSVDPLAAARFVEMHAGLPDSCITSLMSNWASMDPAEARAWLERQPKSVQSLDVINFFLSGWAESDEPGALAYAVAHASDENFATGINDLAINIFRRSLDEARTFLFRLPEEVRNSALIWLMQTEVGTRPLKDVANWLLTFPEECRGTSMSELLQIWTDPDEMENWLSELRPETHDRLLAEYCSFDPDSRPDLKASAGMGIKNQTLRDQSLRELMKHWLPESHDDAVDALENSLLSDAELQYLINLLPKE